MRLRKKIFCVLLCGMLGFSLSASYPAAEAHAEEVDAGGTRADAKEIEVNRIYQETTSNSTDVDVFRFTTTKRGYFQVKLSQNAADAHAVHNGWDVKIMDQDGNILESEPYTYENWTSIILPYAQSGRIFYVQVQPGGYGPEDGTVFDLNVAQTESKNWEIEPNNVKADAVSIQTNTMYHGITGVTGDEDFYKFNLSGAGKVNIRFRASDTNQADSVHAGWDVFLYDKDSNTLSKMDAVKTSNSVSVDLKKGTYYIYVKPWSGWGPDECRYELTVSFAKKPSTPVISSVKAKGKTATVKWKKTAGVTGYYVYRSTSKNKGYKKVATVKGAASLSWKNKGLKARNYYYKVAAYTKVNGMTVVSAYSKTKSVKIK